MLTKINILLRTYEVSIYIISILSILWYILQLMNIYLEKLMQKIIKIIIIIGYSKAHLYSNLYTIEIILYLI